ncbi:TetR/AcrR family transcriptional regulator [Neobacillus notoginsengisoli]|uniref:TetR/AcrR family transcriptional regulator n=1 Tax=Neobacillus notoginsengisoli TaxID=1578198 RepID=A0A417YUA9_9BACI|nr:forespore capture DNA-binding protein RefZ [Neobacillus notoginsengisoli]RHW40763.1 TetR/AcrR family transcriptional regulator [Neobacillus notoginsengisoli]
MRKNSKKAIVTAAIALFNTKGYAGTSIRDIAAKANANPSTISYYFDNKLGLLEYCFTDYFERYIKQIEESLPLLDSGAAACLKKALENILYFQCSNIQMSRFIAREMSLDSQIVREIMSTYFQKEKYYFQEMLETGMKRGEFRKHSPDYALIQLKGLLTMPFLNPHYITEVLHVFPHERYFAEKYLEQIELWLEGTILSTTVGIPSAVS